MIVIFVKDVARVGQRDEVKDIADGYALNFLIPRGLAIQATPDRLEALKQRQKASLESSEVQDTQWSAIAKKLSGVRIVVAASANEQGHLYREVKQQLVVEGIKEECGIDVPSSSIILDKAIKQVGEHHAEFSVGRHSARFIVDVMKAAEN